MHTERQMGIFYNIKKSQLHKTGFTIIDIMHFMNKLQKIDEPFIIIIYNTG